MAQDNFLQTINQLKSAGNILIMLTSGSNPDTVSAALALKEFLTKLGKQVRVLSASPVPAKLNFLPESTSVSSSLGLTKNLVVEVSLAKTQLAELSYQKREDKLEIYLTPREGEFNSTDLSIKPSVYPFDLVVTMAVAELSEFGSFYASHAELFFNTPVTNIDYRPTNENYGQINLVSLTSSGVSEIVYDLLSQFDPAFIDGKIATLLLAGLIAQTNSFQSNKTTPHVFTKASSLVSLGAKQQEIITQLYRNKTLGLLRLWGRVLARLKQDDTRQIVYSQASAGDIEKSQATETDVDDILSEMIAQLNFAKTFIFFVEQPGKTLVYAATTLPIGLAEVLAAYSPQTSGVQGYKFAVAKTLTDTEAEITSLLNTKLTKLE